MSRGSHSLIKLYSTNIHLNVNIFLFEKKKETNARSPLANKLLHVTNISIRRSYLQV